MKRHNLVQISVFFKKTKFLVLKSMYKTPIKQISISNKTGKKFNLIKYLRQLDS